MPTRLLRLVAVAAASAVLVAGCGGGGDDRPSLADKAESSGTVTTTPLPAWASLVAQPIGTEIAVHEQPDASSPSKSYPNPWQLDENPDHVVPQVFLVESEQKDWVEVLLPVRPNGTTGWVRKQDVRLTPNRYSIDISLADRQITVHDADQVLIQEPVAIGASETPTPPGKYFLRVLLKAPDPNTVYGPYAYGLSAHSDVLTTFNGGDGEIGIHGNNDASVLGKDITHGCIRISNESVTRLAGILPLGTPVDIVA
jgi:lipoprotein-anchoring transpeptidase ErfK/SrfK